MEGEIKRNTATDYIVTNYDSVIAFQNWKNYDIDWSKVRTLEDVINVLRGLRITVSMDESNPNPDFAPLMPYLTPKS